MTRDEIIEEVRRKIRAIDERIPYMTQAEFSRCIDEMHRIEEEALAAIARLDPNARHSPFR